MRRLPNWIGVGCVKCGTSWAWQQLKQHPQIYSPCKELNYFNFVQIFHQKDYECFFEGGDADQKIGEWTPDYFHHPEAMHNIKEAMPWTKLIVLFRHPVERAWSNYKHALYTGIIENKTFNQAWNIWRISQRSIYSTFLAQWYKLFDKEQIKIMWYEDIKTQPIKFLQEIFRFLEIDDKFVPDNYTQQFKFHYHSDDYINSLKLHNVDRQKWLERYLPYTKQLEDMTGKNLNHWKI